MTTKSYQRDTEQAAIITKTARITGVSKRYVRMVIAGRHHNDAVMDTYMLFQEGNEALLKQAIQINRAVRKHAGA